ncbi:hypothetical protein Tco_0519733 [Tanacetum coccineum]
MTRSSTKELLSPFENPEQKFRSKRRFFDTPSLIESNSPEFGHIFYIKEQSEERERETMTETMEQYMSKTRENYGSGVTRPTINQDTPFEWKGQFLKELRDNTFCGSEHEDANEHIKKVLEIEVILFYNGLDVPTRQILDSKGDIPSKTVVDAKIAIQEMAGYSQKWHNGTSSRTRKSAKRHEEKSNIIKEIRASTDAAIRNQGASIKTLEIQIGQMSKVLQERGFGSLPSSTEINPRDQVKSISTAKADFSEIRRIRHEPYAVSGT